MSLYFDRVPYEQIFLHQCNITKRPYYVVHGTWLKLRLPNEDLCLTFTTLEAIRPVAGVFAWTHLIPAMAFLLLFPHLLASLLILLPISAVAQNNGNITVGRSLTATDYSSSWLSPSGDFAFGFRPLSDKNDLFLLSIWFAKIPDKTIFGMPLAIRRHQGDQ